MMLDRAHRPAQHRSDKKRRCKSSAGRPAQERKSRRQQLQCRQHQQYLPGELPVHRLVHDRVARAHHLRKPDADHSDQ